MVVRTRFAPSPTGYLHIGGARTALFNWLFARHHGGRFVLRVEDTDRERSTDASVQAILDGMAWLGLDADEGPFFQTQRFDRYREVVRQLLDGGHAYRCYSSPDELEAMRERARARGDKPRYDGTWRDSDATPPSDVQPVIRFRNPTSGSVVIDDAVKGKIVIDNAELDDLVIQRADGSPTYNLSVVVDDMDMAITHVIRGDDHINNTPRQINILEALGAARPVYAHLPMILGEDGKRMSKRHGAVGVMQYRDDGYPADALLNYLVRLGWSHGDRERFTRDEMIELFTLDGVNRAGAVFDRKKLDSVSQQWLQSADAHAIAAELLPHVRALGVEPETGSPLVEVVESLRDRSRTLLDMAEQAVPFYRAPADYDAKLARKLLTPDGAALLEAVRDRLGSLTTAANGRWDAAAVQTALEAVARERGVGFGKIGQPLRLAMTGGGASPSMSDVLALLDPADVRARLDAAVRRARESVPG